MTKSEQEPSISRRWLHRLNLVGAVALTGFAGYKHTTANPPTDASIVGSIQYLADFYVWLVYNPLYLVMVLPLLVYMLDFIFRKGTWR